MMKLKKGVFPLKKGEPEDEPVKSEAEVRCACSVALLWV